MLLTLLDAQIGMGRPKEMNVELPREGEGQMSYPPYSQAPHIKIWLAGLSKKMLAVPNLFGGKFWCEKQ